MSNRVADIVEMEGEAAMPLGDETSPRLGNEAFMTLLLAMNDTRKRIAILCVLSFLALC